MEKITDKDNVI